MHVDAAQGWGGGCLAIKVYIVITKHNVDIISPFVLNPQVGNRGTVSDELEWVLVDFQGEFL